MSREDRDEEYISHHNVIGPIQEETEEDVSARLERTYFDEMKEYFVRKNLDIPESFWSDPTALEMIASRRNTKGPKFPWYRCPWCKRVPKSAHYEYVFQHMYGRMSTRSQRPGLHYGCKDMPPEHREKDEMNQLVDPDYDLTGETRREYFFIEPEEISPLVAIRSERFSKKKKPISQSSIEPARKRKKSDDEDIKSHVQNKPTDQWDLPIDLSAGPSHRSQDMSHLLPSTSEEPTEESDQPIDLSAGPSHRQDDIGSPPQSSKRSKGTSLLLNPSPKKK